MPVEYSGKYLVLNPHANPREVGETEEDVQTEEAEERKDPPPEERWGACADGRREGPAEDVVSDISLLILREGCRTGRAGWSALG